MQFRSCFHHLISTPTHSCVCSISSVTFDDFLFAILLNSPNLHTYCLGFGFFSSSWFSSSPAVTLDGFSMLYILRFIIEGCHSAYVTYMNRSGPNKEEKDNTYTDNVFTKSASAKNKGFKTFQHVKFDIFRCFLEQIQAEKTSFSWNPEIFQFNQLKVHVWHWI